MEIADVINVVNDSLIEAQMELSGNNVKLTKASVSLKTVHDRTLSGGFKLLIFSIGGNTNYNNTNTVTFSFSEPPATPSEEKGLDPYSDLVDTLKDAIIDGAELFINNPDIENLVKENFKLDLALSITRSGDLGISFEVFNTGVDLGGNAKNSFGHTISLTFSEI